MRTLVDVNLPLRAAQPDHKQHATAVRAVQSLEQAGDELCIVPQVLYEFWTVASKPLPPAANGLGFTTDECVAQLRRLRASFRLLPEPPDLPERWEDLVTAHRCVGKAAHDARLVAAAQAHGVNRILTFNGADFTRYAWLTVLPAQDFAPPPA